jgi:probable rRNA maturation factor
LSVVVEARGRAARKVTAAARERLRKRIARAMAAAGEAKASLSLSLVDDEEIRVLNRDFRAVDKATDVLSFSMREGEGGQLHPELLGDVVISVETAVRQAEEVGRTLEEELLCLAVHGLAHLCGYDHATVDEEGRMFGWEAKLRDVACATVKVKLIPRP